QDHSYVQELISQGTISVDQARNHPHRNVVTQALGITDPKALNVETMTGELLPGMQLLLCSDGLTEEVDDGSIARVLAHTECSAQECVDGLVAAALDNGGSDNVTVVLVRRARGRAAAQAGSASRSGAGCARRGRRWLPPAQHAAQVPRAWGPPAAAGRRAAPAPVVQWRHPARECRIRSPPGPP